jgi:predicted molibdopterin-dependent oxidoreductase YjgC
MSLRRTFEVGNALLASAGEFDVAQMRIDGVAVEFREGETILEVARRAGITIPTLCYDPRLRPGGSCRLCMVEMEDRPQSVAACTFPAAAELSVRTQSKALRDYRRTLLELVLSTLPEGECCHCAEIGPCDLHRLAAEYGAAGLRFRGSKNGARADDDNPFVLRDYEWCISCYRCTRMCNDYGQAHAMVPGGHGFSTRITTLFERGLMDTTCEFCGQCISTCPTGALADRLRLGRAKAAEITKSVKTVCAFCGTGCTFYLDVADGRIVGVRPDFDSTVSRGSLCVKGQFAWEFVHSADRLTTPLVRKNGELREATWDEAYDAIAERLGSIKDAYGPDSIVFMSSSKATNEANYLLQKMARAAIGTNNIDNCARN